MNIAHAFQSEHIALSTYFKKQLHADVENVAKSQWICIDALVKEYQNKEFTKLKHGTRFFDDRWDGLTVSIVWSKHTTEENFAFVLMCRIVAFTEIEIQDNRSFTDKVNAMLNNKEFYRATRVLHAKRGQPMVPMIYQETKDIEDLIVESGVKSTTLAIFFSKLRHLPLKYFQNMSLLQLKCDLPWAQIKPTSKPRHNKEYVYMASLTGGSLKTKSYKPIASAHVSKIVAFAIPLINKHASDLVEIFETAVKYCQPRLQGWQGGAISAKGRDKILFKHQKWLADEFDYHYTDADHTKAGEMYTAWVNRLYKLVQAACLWILMLTTALRNSDTRKLKQNCYVKATNSETLFYLLTDIQKTNLEDFVIPVCQNTVNAIELLGNMSQVPDDESDLLACRFGVIKGQSPNFSDGKPLNDTMRILCAHLGIDIKDNVEEGDNDEGLAHRIRYTMAEFIGTHSYIAVLLLQRLFGHKSSAMSNMYLSTIKSVQEQRDKMEEESRVDLCDSLANAVVNAQIAGRAGQKLKMGAEHIKKEIQFDNPSLTEGELEMTLKEHISEMLQNSMKQGSIYALKTPMGVICMRHTLLTDDAPCATKTANTQRQESNVARIFTEALGMLPDPANCIGIKCPHALLADPISKILLRKFDYYVKYLKGMGFTGMDIKVEATNFIKLYRQPLSEVFAEIQSHADIEVVNV